MKKTILVVLALGSPAVAEPFQLGAFGAGRRFSDDSRLGFVEESRGHPSLNGSLAFGVRAAKPIWRWLIPELELGFARTDTTPEDGRPSVNVTWFEPRVQLRIEPLRHAMVHPFVLAGAGAPVVFTPSGYTMQSGVTGEGYAGLGVRVATGPVMLRVDARVIAHPGIEFYVTREYEAGLGVELAVGRARPRKLEPRPIERGPDTDRDGIADAVDRCVDRPEDRDGFEDADGCPDIDNDLDHVLDISDRCATQPESYNGWEDDDGCPDELPAPLAAIRGVVPGLLFPERGTDVNDSALANMQAIAKTLAEYPAVRIVLVGHTDNAEAKADDVDLETASEALATSRAESVRDALVAAGVAKERIVVEGRGFDAPLAGNDTPRDRLTNRRVELKLWVPTR